MMSNICGIDNDWFCSIIVAPLQGLMLVCTNRPQGFAPGCIANALSGLNNSSPNGTLNSTAREIIWITVED